MAGIYLHIPFCRKACHYCNFHFSTSLRLKKDLLNALQKEIGERKVEAAAWEVETIYFGGGTPSLLTKVELQQLLSTIYQHYNISSEPEITLEANPDDLTPAFLDELLEVGINRLSIGIQSFRDEDLTYMNRSHNGLQAMRCLEDARSAGFQSLNADLIYGVPGMDDQVFRENIYTLLEAGVDHISGYALTVEPKTALDHFIRSGASLPIDEHQAFRQFTLLKETLRNAGFEHYEISNWALPGKYSRHNTSYWQGVPYLGFGPAAHSYDGAIRSWNISHNPQYILGINVGHRVVEKEMLSPVQRYNEYVLTRLRTSRGCRWEEIDVKYQEHFLQAIKPYLDKAWVLEVNGVFTLTDEGQFFADGISADLFSE